MAAHHLVLEMILVMPCSQVEDEQRQRSQEVHDLEARVSAIDGEKTLMDMERKAEDKDRTHILDRAESAERQVSDLTSELERLASDKHPFLPVPIASVSDAEPCDLSQKLKAAQKEVGHPYVFLCNAAVDQVLHIKDCLGASADNAHTQS
jgi:hypothetical protein